MKRQFVVAHRRWRIFHMWGNAILVQKGLFIGLIKHPYILLDILVENSIVHGLSVRVYDFIHFEFGLRIYFRVGSAAFFQVVCVFILGKLKLLFKLNNLLSFFQ